MKANNLIKITSINLALVTFFTVGGCKLKIKNEENFNTTILQITTTKQNYPDIDELVTDSYFETTEEIELKLDDETLREEFEKVLLEKNFDFEAKELLRIIYDTIDKNYDEYCEANKFLRLPSKQKFIKTKVIECLKNNVSSIKIGSFMDPQIRENLMGANACYYHGTGEIYIGTNDSTTKDMLTRILAHEFLGHANQNLSVDCFDELEDILIEGNATWYLELFSDEYCYNERHFLYNGNDSISTYGPDIANDNNIMYKMYGILTVLTDYSVIEKAYQTKDKSCIIKSLEENSEHSERILELMNLILKYSNQYAYNETTIQLIKELDSLVMDSLVNNLQSSSTNKEQEERLLRLVKFEQQYMSRNSYCDDNGDIMDNTNEVNNNLQQTKQKVIKYCVENNVLSGYKEEDYFKLLLLSTPENNKKIGISTEFVKVKNV